MDIKEMSLKDIKPYEKNPRKNDKAVPLVAASIKEFGFKVPIVIDKNNVIVAGHTRYKAAKKLGLKSAPCIIAEDLTDDQIKAFRLADNKVSEAAEWDFDLLDEELADLVEFDMEQFGFETDVDELPEEVEEDDFEVELPEEPKAKRGDIYQLGRHRLMCGDSTSIDDLEALLDGNLAHCVCTDPPYNMGYQGAGNTPDDQRKKNKILNDSMPESEFKKFLTDVYKTMYCGMEDGASCYVFYKEMGYGTFITSMMEGGITFKQELIWVKNQLVLGGSKYQSMYEPCLMGCKGKSIKFWYGGRNQTSVIESIDLMDEDELRQAIRELTEAEPVDIIREHKPLKNDLHPTMKPIKLIAKLIKNSTDKKHNKVLDLFGGSGSTLMAAEQLGLDSYVMELDEKYVDVIIERWETFTGQKAVLLNAK